jgi:hypothetical protein
MPAVDPGIPRNADGGAIDFRDLIVTGQRDVNGMPHQGGEVIVSRGHYRPGQDLVSPPGQTGALSKAIAIH